MGAELAGGAGVKDGTCGFEVHAALAGLGAGEVLLWETEPAGGAGMKAGICGLEVHAIVIGLRAGEALFPAGASACQARLPVST